MGRFIVIFVVVVAALLGVLLYSQTRTEPLKVSGFVEADEIRLGSRVGGRVSKVSAAEGQTTHKGDVLVELEPYDLRERLAEATAQLAARKAELDRLTTGFRAEEIAQSQAKRDELAVRVGKLKAGPRKQEIAAAEARVVEASAHLEVTRTDLTRMKATFERGASSRDELDHSEKQFAADIATLDVRKQELDQLKEGTRAEDIAEAEAQLRDSDAALALMKAGYRAEEIAQAKASAEAAEASVRAIQEQIRELTVRAPVDGVIEAVELQPGDLIGPNAPALSLLDTSNLWVRAYVPENRLNVQVGRKVTVTTDSFPNRKFAGHVSFVARQAEFTPNNVQTPEERSKQVFRIKVTLDEGLDVLRPGMIADVWLGE